MSNRWDEYTKAREKTDKLKKSNDARDHEKVLEMLKEAGNEVGVFDGVFTQVYEASDAFKKYIVPKVIEHEFYRYKCVVEGVAWGFGLEYPIKDSKKFMLTLNDILSGDYKKYLDTQDTQLIYTLLSLLPLVDNKAYQKYFEDALVSPDKYKRFMAFYFASHCRTDKLSVCNTHFAQDDIEMYAPLLDCIPSYFAYRKDQKYKTEGNGKIEEELFYKLCELQEKLPKKNIIYKTSEHIWFQHGIMRDEISGKAFYLLLALENKKLIRLYEEKYYPAMDAKEKVAFVNLFKPYLQLDYRTEMLNFFGYHEGYSINDKDEKYFLSNPLNFDEAVIVSGYLKTKKTDVKKHIVEHFQRMPDKDKAKLKEYLSAAAEDYKNEAADDLTGLKEQKKTIEQTAAQAPAKRPKVTVQNMSENRVVECFVKLKEFVQKNMNYEYRAFNGQDVLFGANYWALNKDDEFPLQSESDMLIKDLCLSPDELAYFEYVLLLMNTKFGYRFDTTTIGRKLDDIAAVSENRRLALQYFIPMLRHFIKENNSAEIQKARVHRMISVLGEIKMPPNASEEEANLWTFVEEDKKPEPLWRRLHEAASALNDGVKYGLLDKETLSVYAEAVNYAQKNPTCPNIFENSQEIFSHLHEKGVMAEKELFEFIKKGGMDIPNILFEPTEFWQQQHKDRYLYSGKHSKEYIDLVERAIMFMLDTEIERNQAETIYTSIIARCSKLFGVQYYLKALQAFQKMTMPRSSYGWGRTKDDVFANIVASAIPYKTDAFEDFEKITKELKLTDNDLVKGAVFNNNRTILEWTDRLLGKKGFISTVMFFKAHLKDENVSRSVKDKIAVYSPIDISDFKEGAVDVDWFWRIKEEADDKTFQLVYDNAKYITVANFHKRAQRFNDALTGKLTKKECTDKINETRNKEFILYYSLIPLSDDKDIDERYSLIMHFLQESKQFGAQRQASEKKACEVALENLARISGYDDVDRFVWFMESKSADRIAAYFEPKQIDGVQVYLSVSDRFKVSVTAVKNGRETAAIPASLKNDPYVLALKAEIPALNKQSSRVIKSLEAAMEKESKFTVSELQTIAKSPLIKQILSPLFFVANEKVLTYPELITANEKECIIAHPLDLLRHKAWGEKQKYLLSNQIRQPFKQAFRELYTKTDDEKDAKETNRYQGHQISVQKAIAVAKGRGWHTGEDIGLQKVFYKENIVAVLFGIWDFGYSSFDDHPTLSSVYFIDRKTFEVIPLSKINDKMFSEVMRDIDLVVSTSHPQGYDFEESLSTVEVRRQICQNIAELLNLNNVSTDGNFVKIKGSYGEYAVNLRSAIVSKQLAGALNILAINDSTQNKVFLNFIDDNPITVEVVSKMLLLADDTKIKDINILRELKK